MLAVLSVESYTERNVTGREIPMPHSIALIETKSVAAKSFTIHSEIIINLFNMSDAIMKIHGQVADGWGIELDAHDSQAPVVFESILL